jgi:hypothetical protein
VLQERTLNGAAQHALDLDGLQSGAYLVQVRSKNFTRTLPLIRQH